MPNCAGDLLTCHVPMDTYSGDCATSTRNPLGIGPPVSLSTRQGFLGRKVALELDERHLFVLDAASHLDRSTFEVLMAEAGISAVRAYQLLNLLLDSAVARDRAPETIDFWRKIRSRYDVMEDAA